MEILPYFPNFLFSFPNFAVLGLIKEILLDALISDYSTTLIDLWFQLDLIGSEDLAKPVDAHESVNFSSSVYSLTDF